MKCCDVQCSVHTTSGINSLDRQRYAWQVRFIADTEKISQSDLYPVMGSKLAEAGYELPRVWPSTHPEEDAVRAEGELTLTRPEWLQLLLSHPQHLLVTNTVRTLEMIGAFNPQTAPAPALTAVSAVSSNMLTGRGNSAAYHGHQI